MGKLGLRRLAEEGWDCESRGALEESPGSEVLALFVGGLRGGTCEGATDVEDAILVWYLLWGAESGKCEGAASGARTGAALWLLWEAVVDPPRVFGMIDRWNEAQRLRIREGTDGEAEIFARGGWCAKFSHRVGGCAKFLHRVLFTRAFEEFGLDGDGKNLWPLRAGKAGLGMKKIFHDD